MSSSIDGVNWIEFAQREIFETYGHVTRVGRKSLRKYGFSDVVDNNTEYDVSSFVTASVPREVVTTSGNPIDSISSDDASDTNISIYLEGMVRDGNNLTLLSQVVMTDAVDGRTRVAIPQPYSDSTRIRGATTGNVWVYQNTALTAGKPTDLTKIHNQMVAGEFSSLKAGTAVASSNYFLMTSAYGIPGRLSGTNAIINKIRVSNLGEVATAGNFVDIEPWTTALGSPPGAPNGPPYRIIRPNSRIQLTAQNSAASDVDVFSGFAGIFLDIVEGQDQLQTTRSKVFI